MNLRSAFSRWWRSRRRAWDGGGGGSVRAITVERGPLENGVSRVVTRFEHDGRYRVMCYDDRDSITLEEGPLNA